MRLALFGRRIQSRNGWNGISSRGAALLALGIALAPLSCGKRGDPLPPLRPVPEPTQELVVRQVGDELRLEWKAPSRNQDGTTENLDLREVRVMRRVVDVAALVEEQTKLPELSEPAPPESTDVEVGEEVETGEEEDEPQAASTPAPPRPALVIPPFEGAAELVSTLPAVEPGKELRFEEPVDPEWMGKRVEYAVLHVNQKKRASPLSAIVQVEPRPELPPPAAVSAAAGDGFVALQWESPDETEPAERDGIVGYTIFRRLESDASYPDSPLTGDTTKEKTFEDRTALFGTSTCYVVSAILEPAPPEPVEERQDPPEEGKREPQPIVPVVPAIASPPRIESRPSEEVCLAAEDVFAPTPPSGLVGVEVGDGILLTWRVVDAPDLRGYRVYRRVESGGEFELLEETETASYTDTTAVTGERYLYAVTAVDGAPAENESPRSEAVLATRRE